MSPALTYMPYFPLAEIDTIHHVLFIWIKKRSHSC